MQTLLQNHYQADKLAFTMDSQVSSLYSVQNDWASSRNVIDYRPNALRYSQNSLSQTHPLNASPNESARYEQQFSFSECNKRTPDQNSIHIPSATAACNLLVTASTVPARPDPATMHTTSPSIFTTSNDTMTISPLETQFGLQSLSSPSSIKCGHDGLPRADGSKARPGCSNKARHNISQAKNALSNNGTPLDVVRQTSFKRRRRSEHAEPGSARAVYLEKNRQAASKCRGKQKRQQEELVEEARDFERQNKRLKAEVDLLQAGIQDLMEIVCQHSDCSSDSRLRLYIQREASRCAAGGRRTCAIASSPKGPPLGVGSFSTYASSSDTP